MNKDVFEPTAEQVMRAKWRSVTAFDASGDDRRGEPKLATIKVAWGICLVGEVDGRRFNFSYVISSDSVAFKNPFTPEVSVEFDVVCEWFEGLDHLSDEELDEMGMDDMDDLALFVQQESGELDSEREMMGEWLIRAHDEIEEREQQREEEL